MKRKITKTVIIGLIILFIGASVTSGISTKITDMKPITPVGMASGWSDNFDTYSDGQFLDGSSDDGGWRGWNGVPSGGSYVTGAMYRSAPHSCRVEGASDTIHEFTGYTSGVWNFSAWVFVPDDYEGQGDFILLSIYYDFGDQEGNHWAVQLALDSFLGVIESQWGDLWNLPLITERWVEVLCVIDLDADWLEIYYDGELLDYREWTAGLSGAYDCILDIACVNLWGNGATPVYYDDISLRPFGAEVAPDLVASGSLSWENVSSGGTVNSEITVANGVQNTQLDWEIVSWPDFGDWTFTPSSGENLEGSAVVQVSVVVPDEKQQAFSGEVKIVNSEDSGDFVIIPVSLSTPKNKAINTPFLNFLENHPHLFPLLRHLLEL